MSERPVFRPSSVDDYLPDQGVVTRRTSPDAPPRSRLPEGVSFPDRPTWPVDLRHEELVLRPMRYRDAGQWRQLRERNKAWNAPWDATPPPVLAGLPSARPASHAAMVRSLNQRARAGTALPFALCVDGGWPERATAPSRLPVGGQVTVNNIVYGSARFASIGYWIDESLAGRGLMPRAVALTVDYCFQVLGLHRIEVNVRPENTKSLRVVQKLGLRSEGLRPRFLHIDGEWRDHVCFVVLDEEVPGGLLNRLLASRSSDHFRER